MPVQEDWVQPISNPTSLKRQTQVQVGRDMGQITQVSPLPLSGCANTILAEVHKIHQRRGNLKEDSQYHIPAQGGTRPDQPIPAQIQKGGQPAMPSMQTPQGNGGTLSAAMSQVRTRMLANTQQIRR
jgi:hypothetical protein